MGGRPTTGELTLPPSPLPPLEMSRSMALRSSSRVRVPRRLPGSTRLVSRWIRCRRVSPSRPRRSATMSRSMPSPARSSAAVLGPVVGCPPPVPSDRRPLVATSLLLAAWPSSSLSRRWPRADAATPSADPANLTHGGGVARPHPNHPPERSLHDPDAPSSCRSRPRTRDVGCRVWPLGHAVRNIALLRCPHNVPVPDALGDSVHCGAEAA